MALASFVLAVREKSKNIEIGIMEMVVSTSSAKPKWIFLNIIFFIHTYYTIKYMKSTNYNIHNEKKAIVALCKMYGIYPERKRGQNFLCSKEILKKIVESAEVQAGDSVLEVGPGFGTLTSLLADRAKHITAVEIDEKFVSILNDQLAGYKNISIVRQDILRFNPSENFSSNYKIVSNLPYNITSHFLRKFLTEKNKPKVMALLLQKEVVERICAKPGTMSLLSFSVQFFADAKIIGLVAKENFWPEPKVDSAIVKITPYTQEEMEEKQRSAGVDEKSIFRLVKFGFSSRRKQLHNNLASGFSSLLKKKVLADDIKEIFQKLSIQPQARAQDISVEKWLKLASRLYEETTFTKRGFF